MAKRAIAREVPALGLFLGLACLFFFIPSLAVSATFVNSLVAPTRLAIHLKRVRVRGLDSEQTAQPNQTGQTKQAESTVLRMHLVGANPHPQAVGLNELPGKSNYFIGSDPHQRDLLSLLEKGIVSEINFARTQPQKYASFLENMKPSYKGNLLIILGNGRKRQMTKEGVRAVDEAIAFLKSAKPISPLKLSKGLSLAARDHLNDIGPKGMRGHVGSDGRRVSERMSRYGSWEQAWAENISYGEGTARRCVMKQIIDDGIRSRDHRKNLFDPNFRKIGLACGYHAKYKRACVMDFAADYIEQ